MVTLVLFPPKVIFETAMVHSVISAVPFVNDNGIPLVISTGTMEIAAVGYWWEAPEGKISTRIVW